MGKATMASEWISEFNPLAQFLHFSVKHGDCGDSEAPEHSEQGSPSTSGAELRLHDLPCRQDGGTHMARCGAGAGTGPGTRGPARAG